MTFTAHLGTGQSTLGQIELGYTAGAVAPLPPTGFATALSLPVRPRANRAPFMPFESFDAAARLSHEAITLDKWYVPFGTPRWQRRPLLPFPPAGGVLVSNPADFPPDPVAFQMRAWEVPLSRPVLPRYNGAARQPFVLLQLDQGQVKERIFWDAIQEGMGGVPALRHPGRRKDTHRLPCGFLVLSTSQLAEFVFEPALESMRHRPWGRPPMRANGQGLLQLDQGQTAETIVCSEWWTDLSRPTPRRPSPRLPWLLGIGEHYDPDLFAVPFVLLYRWPMLTGGLG